MANIAKDFYGIPERAVQAFERWSGLQVAVHSVWRRLGLHLPPTRENHRNPFCDLLKVEGFEPECADFEADQLRPWLTTCPEGCVKRCHAGIIELSVPVTRNGKLSAVLFAGLCRAADGLNVDFVDSRVSTAYELWPKHVPHPRPIDNDEAQLYLEGLRQLAARLERWMQRLSELETPDHSGPKNIKRTRQQIIHRFINRRFREPVGLEDLAKLLHLSRSRTAHLVREVCGQPLVKLITDVRLRHASTLLRQTELPISEVAARSGFGDISNFHKAFKRSLGLSPLKYRQRNSGHS